MSLYAIQDTTLIGIGDAIRTKGGTSESIPVTALAEAIINLPSGGGSGDVEIPTVVNCPAMNTEYFFAGDRMKWALDLIPAGKTIEFITGNTNYSNTTGGMIQNCTGDYSKVTLNTWLLKGGFGENYVTKLPNIKFVDIHYSTGAAQLFMSSKGIRDIPKNYLAACDSNGNKMSTPYENLFNNRYEMYSMFGGCENLRTLPDFPTFITYDSTNGYGYYGCFDRCYSLDKIEGLPVTSENGGFTSNAFDSAFSYCFRISEMTFQVKPDGSPYVCNWSSQNIDLSGAGYGFSEFYCNEYNGLSKDDEVYPTDSGLVNGNLLTERPDDWWTPESTSSRYNHDSAVRTINSLPDCSAGSGNTIKFRRDGGKLTGPNADNSCGALTDAEIAVATSKGWTVTYYG